MGAKLFFKKATVLVASAAVFGGVAGGVFNLVVDDEKLSAYDNDENDYSIGDFADKLKNNFDTDDDPEDLKEAVSSETGVVSQSTGVITTGTMDVSDIAKEAMPSVVAITVKTTTEYSSGFFGQTYEYESTGAGSGIIIGQNETELLLVTNEHVVEDAETVSVTFIDDKEYQAKVKGTDSDNDLAVICIPLLDIDQDTIDSITIAKLGDSDAINVGEQVVAIGNALGVGQSVTTGIVSAKDRDNDTNNTPLIQTDAAINPGNSGGALLNMSGEVIGINSSKYASTEVEGMGYAIPISKVEDIIDDLSIRVTRDKVDEDVVGFLGVKSSTVSEQMSAYYNMPVGAYVVEVSKNSPAKRAGISEKSIIVKFDGQKITSAEGLVETLEYYKAGEVVDVVCAEIEDGEYVEKTYKVVLGNRSMDAEADD